MTGTFARRGIQNLTAAKIRSWDIERFTGSRRGTAPNMIDLEQLYREEYPRLVRTALPLVDDRASAEDVAQEAFARYLSKWGDRSPRNGSSYLYATTLNLARSRLRRTMRRPVLETAAARSGLGPLPTDPADSAVRSSLSEELTRAIRSLSRRQRECVVLRHIADLSIEETAEVLGISNSSVKTHASRALTALQHRLARPATATENSMIGDKT